MYPGTSASLNDVFGNPTDVHHPVAHHFRKASPVRGPRGAERRRAAENLWPPTTPRRLGTTLHALGSFPDLSYGSPLGMAAGYFR